MNYSDDFFRGAQGPEKTAALKDQLTQDKLANTTRIVALGSFRAVIRGLIRQGLRFALVGLLNTAVGLICIYSILYFSKAGPFIANGIGYAIGFSMSFVLNRSWTFEHKGAARQVLPRYFLVVAVAYVCNLTLVYYVIQSLGWNDYVSQLAGIVMYSSITFIGSKLFVFK